jgi:hypothetical protein
MKIHAMLLVKNEADILQETLSAALHWSDYIYVLDNGSTDGTWEMVKELAQQHPEVVPFKQDDVMFSRALRADIFDAFRSNLGHQDWWCELDADEFYIDDPRIFLAKIPERFQTVYSASLNYYFTDLDLDICRRDPAEYLKIPVQQRLRYYLANHGEPRFFRHRDDILWTRSHDYGGYPPEVLFGTPAYPVRIWLKHYQYRSPEQIQQRLHIRRPLIEAGSAFPHEAKADWLAANTTRQRPRSCSEEGLPEFAAANWEERIVPSAALDYDRFDRRYIVNEKLMPEFPVRPPRSRRTEAIPQPIRAILGRLRRKTRLLLEQILDQI